MGKRASRGSPSGQWLQPVLVILLLALTVLIVLNQANPLTTRLGRDSGMYAYVASHLLRGHTPYVSAWEHKPPGIFFMDALGLALAGGTRWGIWLVEFVSLLAAAIAGYFALRRPFGRAAALGASLLWLAGLSLVLEGGNFTEEFALPFNFISLLLFGLALTRKGSGWLHAAMGLAMGCSFMLRPNNAGVQIAIVLTELVLTLRRQRTWRQALLAWGAMALGFLVPLLAAVTYFLNRGAFQPFVQAAFLFNASYGGRVEVLSAFISGLKHLGFAAGVGLVGMLLAFDRLRLALKATKIDPMLLWLGLDFMLEIVLSGLSGLNYPHYFISWLPWIAFASALLIHRLAPGLEAWFGRRAAVTLLGMLALLSLGSLSTLGSYGTAAGRMVSGRGPIQRPEQLPAYVNEHTQPGETVLVWGGGAGTNFLARRDAPSAHFQYGILAPSDITERVAEEFYQDILSHPPVLIVDEGGEQLPPLSTPNPVQWLETRDLPRLPYVQEFFDFVRAHYSYTTSVTGVDVYRWDR